MPILESDLNRVERTHPRLVLLRSAGQLHAGLDHRWDARVSGWPWAWSASTTLPLVSPRVWQITARSCLLTLFTCSFWLWLRTAFVCPYNTQACKPRTQPSCLQAWCVNLSLKRVFRLAQKMDNDEANMALQAWCSRRGR
jgi:hypothetical protein